MIKLPNANVKPLSSRVYRKWSEKTEKGRRETNFDKKRILFSPFLITLKKNKTKTAYEIVEPSNPTKKAKESLYEALSFLSNS